MVRVSLTLHGALALIFLVSNASRASASRQDLGMQFIRHPQPLAAPLGDEVDFECSLTLAPDKFTWSHRPLNSTRWSPKASQSTGPNTKRNSKLVVTFDDPSKAGDYRCIAYYGTSGLASDPGRLTLAKIDQFADKSDTEISVPAGNTIPISCPVPASSPEATIQFFKDEKPIKSSNLAGGKTLVIENAQPSDSGSYHCAAYNDIASQTVRSNFRTKLTVLKDERPVALFFVKQPQTEYKVLRGGNVTLECFGAAYPKPRVTWSKLVGTLPSGSQYTPSGLMLMNVVPQDQGEYHCIWSSGPHEIESLIILEVVEAPRVTRGPKTSTFSEGGELELSCGTSGQPEPTIEWLINGEPVTNVETKGSTLFVPSVEKKHAGIVQCVASNKYGSHSGYTLLRVNPKQHPGSGGEGHNRQDNHGIPGGVHKHIRMGGKRKNKEGHRRGTVLVPPNQPNVTRLSDVSVMVRWSVPENTGLPIQFFKVQYKEFGSKANSKQSKWMTANMEIPHHVRSFEVPDLQPNSSYRFRIAAVYSNNDNQLSPNSVKFHLVRMDGFDTNKMPIPLLTNTEALGTDRVLLIWQNPDRSADIDGFYVYYRASTTAGDYIKTTVEGKNSTNITVAHLQPDTTYEFKVQSFSVGAASEFSKIIREKTMKVVTEPPRLETAMPDNAPKSTGSGENGSLYAIVGGALGGAALLAVMGAIAFIYKRSSIKQNRDASQNQGKHMTNGRVLNGGVPDSKINITSNPLAVLDTSDTTTAANNHNSLPKSGHYASMEMTSFVNGQNNNTSESESSGTTGPVAVRDGPASAIGPIDHHL